MSVYQQIRFSVKANAIDDVKKLIADYAQYVGQYAKNHDEEWTWSTFQETDTPTNFVSVISHENESAAERHHNVDGTKTFAEKLYKHVTDNEIINFSQVATSLST